MLLYGGNSDLGLCNKAFYINQKKQIMKNPIALYNTSTKETNNSAIQSLFAFRAYRNSLAKDLKDIRKNDSELAKKVLAEEKGRSTTTKEFREWESEGKHMVIPSSTRYEMAKAEHVKTRKTIQTNSPILRAQEEKNKKADLKKRKNIGKKYKKIYLHFLNSFDKKFNEFEPKFLSSLHPILSKNSGEFVYDVHLDHELWVSLDGRSLATDRDNQKLKVFIKIIYDILDETFSLGTNGWQERVGEQHKAKNVQYLSEFQNDIEGESVGIIKTKNLYICPQYSTEHFILCSKSKDALVKVIKDRISRNRKQK